MEDWQLEFSEAKDIFDELIRLRECSMELSIEERLLILNHRAHKAEMDAADAFRRKAIATAAKWDKWASKAGVNLSFSTFTGQGGYRFGYQESDAREMFEAVLRILGAAAPAPKSDEN